MTTEPSEPVLVPYTAPTKSGKAYIYLPVFPATEPQKSWLRGNGFRELAVTPEDLQELLSRGGG
jgi:hypothetical protein